MIEKQLEGVEFVVANTDAQALQQNQSASRIQLGVKVTEGLGAGARAEVGAAAAEESIEQIYQGRLDWNRRHGQTHGWSSHEEWLPGFCVYQD